MRGALPAALAAALFLSSSAARADDGAPEQPAAAAASGPRLLAQARAALEAVDYPGAQALCTRALAAGGMSPAQTAAAHRLAGEVAAALGDAAAAREQFARYLALQPGAMLGADVSPKITEPFAAARAELHGQQLSASAAAGRADGAVRVAVEADDPLQMIESVRVKTEAGAEVSARGLSVELPALGDGAVDLTVSALDAAGNELWTGAVRLVAARPPPRHHRVPGWARWPTWTVVAVASGGATAYFGWRAGKDQDDLDRLNANSSQHTFDEAMAIQDRGRRDTLLTNIGLGVTVAAATAAIITAVIDRPGVEVQPAVTARGGASVSVAVRF